MLCSTRKSQFHTTHNQKRPQVASPTSLRSRAIGEMRSIDIGEATCGRFFLNLLGYGEEACGL